jgi:hypothetical protein
MRMAIRRSLIGLRELGKMMGKFFMRRDNRVRMSLVGGWLRSLRVVWAVVRGRRESRPPRIQKMVLSHGRSRFRT